jgi:hypothetical protein
MSALRLPAALAKEKSPNYMTRARSAEHLTSRGAADRIAQIRVRSILEMKTPRPMTSGSNP